MPFFSVEPPFGITLADARCTLIYIQFPQEGRWKCMECLHIRASDERKRKLRRIVVPCLKASIRARIHPNENVLFLETLSVSWVRQQFSTRVTGKCSHPVSSTPNGTTSLAAFTQTKR
jgi:hypothetical protein